MPIVLPACTEFSKDKDANMKKDHGIANLEALFTK